MSSWRTPLPPDPPTTETPPPPPLTPPLADPLAWHENVDGWFGRLVFTPTKRFYLSPSMCRRCCHCAGPLPPTLAAPAPCPEDPPPLTLDHPSPISALVELAMDNRWDFHKVQHTPPETRRGSRMGQVHRGVGWVGEQDCPTWILWRHGLQM